MNEDLCFKNHQTDLIFAACLIDLKLMPAAAGLHPFFSNIQIALSIIIASICNFDDV